MSRKKQTDGPTQWEVLARERNARVVMCHTPDTYVLTDLARSADRAMRALRDRIYTTVTPEEAEPLFQEYNEVVFRLHQIVEKISGKLGIRYRPPRTVEKMLLMQQDGGDGGNGDDGSVVKLSKASKTKLS